MRSLFRYSLASAAALVILAWTAPITQAQAAIQFDLPAQPLADSLRAVGSQTNINLLFDPPLVAGLRAPALSAQLTADQALSRLLAGTGIQYEFLNENTIVLATAKTSQTGTDKPAASVSQVGAMRLAQGDSASNPETSDPDAAKGGFWKRLLRVAQASEASPSDEQSGQNPKEDSGQGGQLEEIVVTAQKREEKLSDVPISISAYDQTMMDRRGIRDMSDIARVTPGLAFDNQGNYAKANIRGIGYGGPNPGFATATTAIYIDDVAVQSREVSGAGGYTTALPSIFDLERVEVLRGPQGTLFGGSAEGGAIRFITPQPSLTEYSGYARAEIADTHGGGLSNDAGIALGGPIIQDKLGFRVSARFRQEGGYVDHDSAVPGGIRESNSNSTDTYSGRVAITFAPNEATRLTASLYAQNLNGRDSSAFTPDLSDPDDHKFIKNLPLLEPIKDKFYIPSLKIESDFASVRLTSITNYFWRDQISYKDYTLLIPEAFGAPAPTSLEQYELAWFTTDQRTFSQELRLGSADPNARLKWNLGLYYSQMRQEASESIEAPAFPQFILDTFGSPIETVLGTGLVQGNKSYFSDIDTKDRESAAFVNLEFDLTPRFAVIAGVRASKLNNEFVGVVAGPLGGVLQTRDGTQKESPITPKFGINFKANEDNLFYVSAAKGFRPGGVNQSLPTTGDACRAATQQLGVGDVALYDSDSLWSYELGSKNSLFDRRLNIAASVYHVDWSDVLYPVGIPACLGGFIVNLASVESEGFELAADAKLTDRLAASISLGYTNSKFGETTQLNDRPIVRKGQQLGDIPPWTISASLQYDFPILSQANGYFRVEDRYNSRNSGRFPTEDPESVVYYPYYPPNEAVNQLDVRMGATWGNVDISAFVTNLLNESPLTSQILHRANFYGANTIRPLTVGVSGIYRW